MIPRSTILTPIRSLCKAFASGTSTTEDLLTHFTSDAPLLSPSEILPTTSHTTTSTTETAALEDQNPSHPATKPSSTEPGDGASSSPPEALIPFIREHGHPALAPFLGRDFRGIKGVSEYFDLLAKYLSYSDMRFENEDDWVVDTVTRTVTLKGRAKFVWKETGQGWDEEFCWRVVVGEDVGENAGSSTARGASVGSGASGLSAASGISLQSVRDDGDNAAGAGATPDSETETRAKPMAIDIAKQKQVAVGRADDDPAKGSAGVLKIQEYEVWADTGCAYLASKGLLDQVVGADSQKGSGSSGGGKPKGIPKDQLGTGMNVYGSCG